MRSAVRLPWVWRPLLVSTGVHASLVPMALAAFVTVVWRDGMIEAIGPLALAAPLPVLVAVPVLLAVACGISHVPVRTPVVTANARTVAARAISHATVLGAGLVLIVLGDVLSSQSTVAAATRTLLVFAAPAFLVSGLIGPSYAWVPVFVLFGASVLSNVDEATWSIHALVMSPTAQTVQLAALAPLCLVSLGVAALDPLGRAYLPRTPDRRRGA